MGEEFAPLEARSGFWEARLKHGGREYVQVLRLLETFSLVELTQAIEDALELASRASGEEGIAAYLLGDTATAKRKVLAAWEIAKHLGDPGAHIRYASLYGAGQVDLHQYKASLAALDEAINTANATGAAYPTIAVNAKIEALSGLGRYSEAFSLLAQEEDRERQYGRKPHMVELERLRGNAYGEVGDFARASEAYSGAMQQAEAVGYWRGVMQIGEQLAGVYESTGQLPLALSTVDRALELRLSYTAFGSAAFAVEQLQLGHAQQVARISLPLAGRPNLSANK